MVFFYRSSSTDSESEDIMYAIHSSDDRILRDEARESETECDRLCKNTFHNQKKTDNIANVVQYSINIITPFRIWMILTNIFSS